MLFFNAKKRKHTKRQALFMQTQSQTNRPAGPYRPRRRPRPIRRPGLGGFLIVIILLCLIFGFGYIWKAHSVNQTCSRLDALRRRGQDLRERLKAQQLIFQEVTLYSRIEPLARDRLGLYPSVTKPVVIAPFQDQLKSVQSAADQRINMPSK